MEERRKRLAAYFDDQTARCAQRRQALLADDRGDEANFEKIRANVFDIFRTVLDVSCRACGDDPAAVGRFFLARVEQIPANWRDSYAAAEQHGDAAKMHVERVKLDAAEEIGAAFRRIWEGAV